MGTGTKGLAQWLLWRTRGIRQATAGGAEACRIATILFAMANPIPEIMPDEAKLAGARIVGTGRSDFPNQVNNVIAFPGIFKGALEGRAKQITEEMKLAAALAIANLVKEEDLNDEHILPEAFDPQVAIKVSEAVKAHIV